MTRLGNDEIVKAVARTYRQARRRGKLALRSDDPAALHALRARVVDLQYQLAALSSASPAALNAQSEELNALRDTLGDFNDLHVLSNFRSRTRCPDARSAGGTDGANSGEAEETAASRRNLVRTPVQRQARRVRRAAFGLSSPAHGDARGRRTECSRPGKTAISIRQRVTRSIATHRRPGRRPLRPFEPAPLARVQKYCLPPGPRH